MLAHRRDRHDDETTRQQHLMVRDRVQAELIMRSCAYMLTASGSTRHSSLVYSASEENSDEELTIAHGSLDSSGKNPSAASGKFTASKQAE
jgi:hypothetical protein